MSQRQLCACCGQPLPSQLREGIYLSPKKAAIFDAIERYEGIGADVLALRLGTKPNLIRQHVYQINSLLAATRTRISGTGLGMKGCYRLIREKGPSCESWDEMWARPFDWDKYNGKSSR